MTTSIDYLDYLTMSHAEQVRLVGELANQARQCDYALLQAELWAQQALEERNLAAVAAAQQLQQKTRAKRDELQERIAALSRVLHEQ